MKSAISFEQVLQNIKEQSEDSKLTIEAAERTIRIINKIVKTREDLGMTQRDLAKKCGMQQPALARIETCQVIPKLNTLIKIAESVGIKIEAYTSLEKEQMMRVMYIGKTVMTASLYCNDIGGYYGYEIK